VNGYEYLLNNGMYNIIGCNTNFMNYGYWTKDTNTLAEASIKLVEKLIDKNKKKFDQANKILDIGCGRGMQDVIFTKYTNADIYAIDINPNNIKECNKLAKKHKIQDKLNYITADACNLPFDNDSFDVVVSLESAFHYPSRETFINEVKRVLRPGGCFILGDIIINKKTGYLKYLQKFICNRINVNIIHDKDLPHLINNLDKHNFKYDIEDITDSTFIPFYRNSKQKFCCDNYIIYITYIITINILMYLQNKTNIFSYIIANCVKPK